MGRGQRAYNLDRLTQEWRTLEGRLANNEQWVGGRALPITEADSDEADAEIWVATNPRWSEATHFLFAEAGVRDVFDLREPWASEQRERLSGWLRSNRPVALSAGGEVIEVRELSQERGRLDATVTITATIAAGWCESKSARINLANIGDRQRLAQRVMSDPQIDPARPTEPNTWRAVSTASACEEALNSAFVAVTKALVTVPAQALAWETGEDIATSQPDETPYIVEPYFPEAAQVDLVGDPKVGKTTFLGAAFRAMLSGDVFLGHEVRPTRVVFLTEQPRSSLRKTLKDTGLLGQRDIHILKLTDMRARGLRWPEMMLLACTKAREVGAKVIVIDTLAKWAGLRGDEENSAGAMAQALQPVEDAVAAGYCVITVRHERKGGGNLVDSGRGSSAQPGSADILMRIRKPGGKGHRNRRVIDSIGRFDVPEAATLEWHPGDGDVGGSYELIAWSDGAEGDTCELDVHAYLEAVPVEEARTVKELVDALPTHTEPTIRRSLQEMLDRNVVDRRKRGKADEWFAVRGGRVVTLDFGGLE